MITKTAFALAIVLGTAFGTLAATKHPKEADNSYRNQHECHGGSCTALNPDRQQILPNQSAQFYKKHKTSKSASTNTAK
jgi:hypothetical protein